VISDEISIIFIPDKTLKNTYEKIGEKFSLLLSFSSFSVKLVEMKFKTLYRHLLNFTSSTLTEKFKKQPSFAIWAQNFLDLLFCF